MVHRCVVYASNIDLSAIRYICFRIIRLLFIHIHFFCRSLLPITNYFLLLYLLPNMNFKWICSLTNYSKHQTTKKKKNTQTILLLFFRAGRVPWRELISSICTVNSAAIQKNINRMLQAFGKKVPKSTAYIIFCHFFFFKSWTKPNFYSFYIANYDTTTKTFF